MFLSSWALEKPVALAQHVGFVRFLLCWSHSFPAYVSFLLGEKYGAQCHTGTGGQMQGKYIENSHFSFEIRARFDMNAIRKLIYFGMYF